jgi:alkanesulfonate monooxygenase SsuD/methylene tetrahydromethanopterin reductase-like flavin-dependent oxidoreductase (luciferase family)
MPDYGQELRFGAFITPVAAQAADVVALARLAEASGLDLVTVQDHPYQPRFLDAWTLLSVIAAQTATIRVAPNVANLPLRPPAVIARSVASLDILAGGRVELGLGAGAFWDAIEALGGPRRSPGESVAALGEAIDVVRALWDAGGRGVTYAGEHYRLAGARPGPAPAHAVEIWLGVLKPRMLALTGRKGDGWLPSSSYVPPAALRDGNARIDEAAAGAGRDPAAIRRLYNVAGSFGTGAGFLEGTPADWAEQLAGLALAEGVSTFIAAADDAAALQRFATEVVPAVRRLVESERPLVDRHADEPVAAEHPAGVPHAAAAGPARTPLSVQPTPDDGLRLSSASAWDETTRPTGPEAEPGARYSARQQARAQHLIDVHDHLRAEVATVRDLIGQVAAGIVGPQAARTLINRMTIRQNNWTLGAFCESYCRLVTTHHTIEDASVFPHLGRRDARLEPVLARLAEEHEVIGELLDGVDSSLVELVADGGEAVLERVRAAVDLLADAMASHLAYEERELVEPLARLGFGAG